MDVNKRFILLITLLLGLCELCLLCVQFDDIPQCYAETMNTTIRRFGTLTTFTENQKYFPPRTNYKVKNCKPVMLYLVARHAIRYPDIDDIEGMNTLLPQLQREMTFGKGELCLKDIDAIKQWKPTFKPEDENKVTESGENETMNIALKYTKLFKNLLHPDRAAIEIGVTSKTRTNQTANAFIRALRTQKRTCDEDDYDFEEEMEELSNWNPPLEEKDFLLFHDNCKQKIKEKGMKKWKSPAVKNFVKSDLMKNLGRSVRQRLGLERELDFKSVDVMKRACAFEYAIYGSSPWCAAFSMTELQVLEYYEDLEDYLNDAYGNQIYTSSCLLFQDLMDKINISVNNSTKLKTYLYFTHAGALKKLWATLGLFYDQEMLLYKQPEDGFCTRRNRFWRSSLNTPFSSHLLLVLYKCKEKKAEEPKFKLLTTVNTAPVNVKGCESPICDIAHFEKEFTPFANECNLDEICVGP